MLKKLRIRFIAIFMAAVTLLLCVMLGLVVFFMGRGLEFQSMETMQSLAKVPPNTKYRHGNGENPRFSAFVVYLDQNGQVRKLEGNLFLSEEEIPQIAAEVMAQKGQTGILDRENLRFYKNRSPAGQILVLADLSVERATMRNLIQGCIVVGCVAFTLFLILSVLLVRWMIRPVEAAWQQQKQFVADASHELKTPLTVIMTNAELLQEDYPQQEQRQFSASILAMSRQMRGLVDGMLELARADNGTVEMGFEPVDLSALVSDGLLPFEPLYFERNLTLESRVEPGLGLSGSARHLAQVLDILLDNAMKYSTPGGTVRVCLGRQGSSCLLTVASPGAALSREDRKNIFKRFYRVDKARSRDGSYGLGLSIAQQIVSQHRGKIWAESAENVNTFFVQLPLHG